MGFLEVQPVFSLLLFAWIEMVGRSMVAHYPGPTLNALPLLLPELHWERIRFGLRCLGRGPGRLRGFSSWTSWVFAIAGGSGFSSSRFRVTDVPLGTIP